MSLTVHIVRHGEVEHHRTDVPLTERGREQARQVGRRLAARVGEGDVVRVCHSPVTRVRETAELLEDELARALVTQSRAPRVVLHRLEEDPALNNVRFILEPGREPEEPSLLYSTLTDPERVARMDPVRARFYAGFWASRDPMGYWLTHDSGGGAETPETVLRRLTARLAEVLNGDGDDAGPVHWIMVTHSGTMRALLRSALGADPGEPDFCEIVPIEPAPRPGQANLTFRERTVPFDLS